MLTTNPAIIHKTELVGKAHLVKYWPAAFKEQMVVSLGHWMQFLSARVVGVENGDDWHNPTLTIELETPLSPLFHTTAILSLESGADGGKNRKIISHWDRQHP